MKNKKWFFVLPIIILVTVVTMHRMVPTWGAETKGSDGIKQEDGFLYYYQQGQLVTSGSVMVDGQKFMLNESGQLTGDGWHTIHQTDYYFKNGASLARPYEKIGDAYVNGTKGQVEGSCITDALKKGIDVSQWQGEIDWEAVKGDDVSFAMFGLGRLNRPDPRFKENITQALEVGIDAGAYLRVQARTAQEAREEADYAISQIQGYEISYPVAIDFEEDFQEELTKEERTEIIKAYLTRIEEAGYYPMIYANTYWLNSLLDMEALSSYDVWAARWGIVCDYAPTSIWQCSDVGEVRGIAGNADVDFSYRDYNSIITPRTSAIETPQVQGTWIKNSTGWWYLNDDGSWPAQDWKKVANKWYYFSQDGYMESGWQKVWGKWYYLGNENDGAMKSDWQKVWGKWYYLGNENDGAMKSGWQEVWGKWYYLKGTDDGSMLENDWIDGYYVGSNGA